MKKLGKLTLKEMKENYISIGSVEQSVLCGGSDLVSMAISQLGVEEYDGAANNPAIIGYYESTSFPSQYHSDSNSEWCAAFVNWCVQESGGTGPSGAAAVENWVNWGNAVDSANVCAGNIAIRHTGSHMAIVETVNGDGTVTIIEGNSLYDNVKRTTVNINDWDFQSID